MRAAGPCMPPADARARPPRASAVTCSMASMCRRVSCAPALAPPRMPWSRSARWRRTMSSPVTPGGAATPTATRPVAADATCHLWYACLYEPPLPGGRAAAAAETLLRVAAEFSPRYEQHGGDLVSIDVSGLDRLLGSPRTIGEELRRDAADRGLRVHVAIASTRMAALVLALARPGVTIVNRGREAATLAAIPIGLLEKIDAAQYRPGGGRATEAPKAPDWTIAAVKHWGARTLAELAALPAAELAARLGQHGLRWQAIARGEDVRPLVPTQAEERFDASLELEWSNDRLEP